ncbi:hypothetical protein [Candidatus Rhodobacter oscarellae]|uniref:hypothetical protein n=1 Tax=Candidatus Rhodobacter oscarellae TaxID=1675527 RepID=UPI000A9B55CE|nr:hypothetical protein [Candidatus Rhodobacter lobularis]
MKPANEQAEKAGTDWREALAIGFDFGHPSLFNFEWLIDRADRGERSVPCW